MNTAIWIAQGMLAAMFAMAGIMKSTQPIEKLQKAMTWTTRYSSSTVRFIGITELLGAIGVIVPWLTGVAVILTPLAACGLALIQLLAIFHHAKHNEKKEIAINIVLILIAGFVAYGRFQ